MPRSYSKHQRRKKQSTYVQVSTFTWLLYTIFYKKMKLVSLVRFRFYVAFIPVGRQRRPSEQLHFVEACARLSKQVFLLIFFATMEPETRIFFTSFHVHKCLTQE